MSLGGDNSNHTQHRLHFLQMLPGYPRPHVLSPARSLNPPPPFRQPRTRLLLPLSPVPLPWTHQVSLLQPLVLRQTPPELRLHLQPEDSYVATRMRLPFAVFPTRENRMWRSHLPCF